MSSLKIISWNVNGLKGRVTDVDAVVRDRDADVVALQETGVDKSGKLLKLTGYNKFTLSKGRGMSLYVRETIPCELISPPNKTNGIESICTRLSL